MKNYYFFGQDGKILDEDTLTSVGIGEIDYLYITDTDAFENFAVQHNMETFGADEPNLFYYWDNENDLWNWVEDENILDKLKKSMADFNNKGFSSLKKENEEVDTKGKTFNYSIEFKNGGFIKEKNCTKTFDEIFNSVKELYNSPVFGSNIKKISIEIN